MMKMKGSLAVGYANLARLKRIWMMVLVAMWALLLNQGEGVLLISFNKTPPNRTRERDAWFGYTLTDENGRNPCANNCTFSCQIDAKVLNPCYAGGILIMNVPVNQEHTFTLNVTVSTGELIPPFTGGLLILCPQQLPSVLQKVLQML